MTQDNYMAQADVQYLWTNKIKPAVAAKADVCYSDVYIGVAAQSSAVQVDGNHHDTITRGRPLAFSNASGYIWLILPSTYSPVVMMNGMEVPMTQDGTTTVGSVTYKILKSSNAYSGTFNIYLN